MLSRLSWIVLVTSLLVGCSSAPDEEPSSPQVNDPLEAFNRQMWTINYDYLDPYIVRPVSLFYVGYVPKPVRTGVGNFLSNLDEPASVVNNLLMGNGSKAADHFNRFWINTSLGLLGIIDIASEAGIRKSNGKEFSDVVGHYGVGNGPYFMFPGYGPYTLRQVGDLVDGLYFPLVYLNTWAGIGKWTLEGMETRAALVAQEPLLHNSPDPYSLTRDAFIQRRNAEAEIQVDDYDAEQEEYLDEYLSEGL